MWPVDWETDSREDNSTTATHLHGLSHWNVNLRTLCLFISLYEVYYLTRSRSPLKYWNTFTYCDETSMSYFTKETGEKVSSWNGSMQDLTCIITASRLDLTWMIAVSHLDLTWMIVASHLDVLNVYVFQDASQHSAHSFELWLMQTSRWQKLLSSIY